MNPSAQDTILNTLGEKIANLEMTIVSKDTNTEYLRRQLDEREQRIKDGTKANEEQAKRISLQSAEIASLTRGHDALEREVERLKRQVQDKTDVIAEKDKTVKAVTSLNGTLEEQIQRYRTSDSPTPNWFAAEISRFIEKNGDKLPKRGHDPFPVAREMLGIVADGLGATLRMWEDALRAGQHPKTAREGVIAVCAKIAAYCFVVADIVNAWEPHKDKLLRVKSEGPNEINMEQI